MTYLEMGGGDLGGENAGGGQRESRTLGDKAEKKGETFRAERRLDFSSGPNIAWLRLDRVRHHDCGRNNNKKKITF